jgi:hypothetical protein
VIVFRKFSFIRKEQAQEIIQNNPRYGRQYNDQKKSTKGQTMINNTPDRKLKV